MSVTMQNKNNPGKPFFWKRSENIQLAYVGNHTHKRLFLQKKKAGKHQIKASEQKTNCKQNVTYSSLRNQMFDSPLPSPNFILDHPGDPCLSKSSLYPIISINQQAPSATKEGSVDPFHMTPQASNKNCHQRGRVRRPLSPRCRDRFGQLDFPEQWPVTQPLKGVLFASPSVRFVLLSGSTN